MTKTLTKHGNSLALVIDKPILELLKIDAETPLSISTDGRCLIIAPADPRRRKKFEAALANTLDKYHDVFKRLAE
jgi:antitoxin MazE